MPFRRATERDEEEVARLCSQAFWDDELLGCLMHPHRNEYPDEFTDYFRRRNRKHLKDTAHNLVVSTIIDCEGHEIVTGFADWLKQGGQDESAFAGTTDEGKLPVVDKSKR